MLKNKQFGFTMVETMIVLAVTGAMFVSTAILVSGQIDRYRYRDSMYALDYKIRNVINSVQSGYYPVTASRAPIMGTSLTTDIAGKLITFGATSFTVDTLTIATGQDPASVYATSPSNLSVEAGLTETFDYPSGVDFVKTPPVSDVEVYVLYQNAAVIAPGQKFSGGSQTIGLYMPSAPSGGKLCFSSGDRKGSIVVGEPGSLRTTLNMGDDHSGCI